MVGQWDYQNNQLKWEGHMWLVPTTQPLFWFDEGTTIDCCSVLRSMARESAID